MTNRNPDRRFDGRPLWINVGGRLLPLETAVFPEDFPLRLRRLKEASGLTWTAFARPSAWTSSSCTAGSGRAWSPPGDP